MVDLIPNLDYKGMYSLVLILSDQSCEDHCIRSILCQVANPNLHIFISRGIEYELLPDPVIGSCGLQLHDIRPMTQLCHAEASKVVKSCSSQCQLFVIVAYSKVDKSLQI